MTVRIAYIDESYDAQKFCLSAVCIKHAQWAASFDAVRAFRSHLKQQHGFFMRKEIHASDFVSGHGHVAPAPIGKWQRSRIFHSLLQLVATLPEVLIFNVCLDVAGQSDVQMTAWDRLVNRLERTMLEFENRWMPVRKALSADAGQQLPAARAADLDRLLLAYAPRTIVVADEGREADITRALRKMHVFNPIPSKYGAWGSGQVTRNITTGRLIEDPIFKASDQSYFLQLADCVSFALLKREVTPTKNVRRYGLHQMFDQTLTGVCFRPASQSDPLGIVRK